MDTIEKTQPFQGEKQNLKGNLKEGADTQQKTSSQTSQYQSDAERNR